MKSRFSVEQIINILREAEVSGVDTVCREHNIGRNTLYRWRQKFGGMSKRDAIRLKELEKENAELKKMYAEAILDKRILEIALSKNS